MPSERSRTLSATRFGSVFDVGTRSADRHLRLIVAPGNGCWGVTVTKKLSSRAKAGSKVEPAPSVAPACHARRNRVKRRARTAVRMVMNMFRGDCDYIFLVLAKGENASPTELRESMRQLLSKAHEAMGQPTLHE